MNDNKTNDNKSFPPPPEPLRVPIPDSHTHLDFTLSFGGSGGPDTAQHETVLLRTARVDRLVQNGADVASSRWSAPAVSRHPTLLVTLAIPPNLAPLPVIPV